MTHLFIFRFLIAEGFRFGSVHVLTWVRSLVFENFNKVVEQYCEERTKDRSYPVDPVISFKGAKRDTGPE